MDVAPRLLPLSGAIVVDRFFEDGVLARIVVRHPNGRTHTYFA
jgi:hypothetical protein